MKMNKLNFPLAIAMAAVMAFTGCKKGPVKTTMIPDNKPQIGDANPAPPIQNGNPFTDNSPGNSVNTQNNFGNKNTGIAEGPWDPNNYNMDRGALAEQTVHFAFDSAVVKDSEQSKLVLVAEKLRATPGAKLLIEGNCDERGTEEYNRSLGERRALALREELVKQGINADDVHTISYGKDKPVDDGHDEAAFAKNRRGDFVLCLPKAGA
jgi:peptidoglycan-associated lipoprotein